MVMLRYSGKNRRKPVISVIIPTYNEENDIKDLLESLYNQRFKDFEVIVVDNFSNDNTLKIVKKFGRKLNLHIYQIKSNVSQARNFGAKKSKGKILVFLDADNIVPEDYLMNVYKSFNPDAVSSAYYGWGKTIFNKLHKEGISDIPFAIKRSVFLKVKFDESLSAFEDYDFMKRLEKLGYTKVANKNCIVLHKNPDNIYDLFRQQKKWGEQYYYYTKKESKEMSPLIFPVFLFLLLIKKIFFIYGYLLSGLNEIIKCKDKNNKYGQKN